MKKMIFNSLHLEARNVLSKDERLAIVGGLYRPDPILLCQDLQCCKSDADCPIGSSCHKVTPRQGVCSLNSVVDEPVFLIPELD